ncbi:MAG: cation:proton antiporter [Planctomycetota bacterium]|nr:cation:proton antiporter [Planctomycetota bacterium]
MHVPDLILTLALGLCAAVLFGLITHRLGLSPIFGYLLAGVAVGPHTPGFVADSRIASQLAELGVILLMFGVGLHFHLKDLLAVKRIAIPGAIVQSAVATLLGAAVCAAFGWSWGEGAVLGLAISVASTVMLLRVLGDSGMLNTPHGRIAIGWLVVEDIFTVLVLVLLPAVVAAKEGGNGAPGGAGVVWTLGVALVKLAGMAALILYGGGRLIPKLLELVARIRSRELFTLTVLALALGIAAGSAALFGASMALGAFLAGMVVGQSEVHHQAAADALPMRDAFAVIFFVSVGMLFDPAFLLQHPFFLLAVLGVVMIGKPLAAMVLVLGLGYPVRTALTAALGLAQIGEFSFILGELAHGLKAMPREGGSLLVAGALISIMLNPFLFRALPRLERELQARPAVWRLLTARGNRDEEESTPAKPAEDEPPRAVVVGYGPTGRTLTRILRDFGIEPVVVDLNVDTVKSIRASGGQAVYGDAARGEILKAAGLERARYLVATLPDLAARIPVVAAARSVNPKARVVVRAHYLGERAMLEETGADAVAYEEAEVAVALARIVLKDMGAAEERIRAETERIRGETGTA